MFDLEQVCISRLAVCDAAGDNDRVALRKLKRGGGNLLRAEEEDLGGRINLTHLRDDPPGESKLTPGLLVCREADDVDRSAEPRDHAGGHAGERVGDDRLCLEVDRHAAGRVGERVRLILDHELILAEAADVIDAVLGRLRDAGHGLDRKYRILAGSRLAGEHDRAGAVVDRVRDVGGLGAGRARAVDHGFKHLGGGDDALAEETAAGNKILLHRRQPVKRHLDAHVAAGDHDAFAVLADLFDGQFEVIAFYKPPAEFFHKYILSPV